MDFEHAVVASLVAHDGSWSHSIVYECSGFIPLLVEGQQVPSPIMTRHEFFYLQLISM